MDLKIYGDISLYLDIDFASRYMQIAEWEFPPYLWYWLNLLENDVYTNSNELDLLVYKNSSHL